MWTMTSRVTKIHDKRQKWSSYILPKWWRSENVPSVSCRPSSALTSTCPAHQELWGASLGDLATDGNPSHALVTTPAARLWLRPLRLPSNWDFSEKIETLWTFKTFLLDKPQWNKEPLFLLHTLPCYLKQEVAGSVFPLACKDEEMRSGALKVFFSFTTAPLRLWSLRSADSHAASLAAADTLQLSQVENITRWPICSAAAGNRVRDQLRWLLPRH